MSLPNLSLVGGYVVEIEDCLKLVEVDSHN